MFNSAVLVLAAQGGGSASVHSVAVQFLNELAPQVRQKAVLGSDSPERFAFHYVPKSRVGVSWADIGDKSEVAAKKLLTSSLSSAGFERIEQIRKLESVLRERERNPGRDPNAYFFVFFGEPSDTKPWMWRYEGHHLSFSFAYEGKGLVASTPQFLGASPAKSTEGGEPLRAVRDLAFSFLASLTPDQKSKAVTSDTAPFDILSEAKRVAKLEAVGGLMYSHLSNPQRKMLLDLARAHAEVQTGSEASRRIQSLEAEDPANLVFIWMGGQTPGSRHYYRIQGANVLIEYDSTQADGNHIHTVWRNLQEDFGGDLLAKHHEKHRH